jgi:hypothetical protein
MTTTTALLPILASELREGDVILNPSDLSRAGTADIVITMQGAFGEVSVLVYDNEALDDPLVLAGGHQLLVNRVLHFA